MTRNHVIIKFIRSTLTSHHSVSRILSDQQWSLAPLGRIELKLAVAAAAGLTLTPLVPGVSTHVGADHLTIEAHGGSPEDDAAALAKGQRDGAAILSLAEALVDENRGDAALDAAAQAPAAVQAHPPRRAPLLLAVTMVQSEGRRCLAFQNYRRFKF